MKTRLYIFVACAAFLAGATATPILAAAAGTEANAYPRTAGSSADPDGSDGETAEFHLVGIAFSNIPGQTLAIIETGDDRRQRFIREGETIGEMTVKKILNDRVVFDTGRDERIARLNRGFLDSTSDGSRQVFHQPVSVRLPPSDNMKFVEVESGKLAASLGDVNDVARKVNINPIVVYGEPIGIRISPIAPGGVFEELGLQTGDIITAVNGREIRKQDEAIAFLEQIQSGGGFNINVRGSRRNKEIQLIVK
jgi:general secretion pathway protein C